MLAICKFRDNFILNISVSLMNVLMQGTCLLSQFELYFIYNCYDKNSHHILHLQFYIL